MQALMVEAGMAKKTPVRLSEQAYQYAQIASGYTGESLIQYVSRIVLERAKLDVDHYHDELKRREASASKPKGREKQ